MKNSSACSDELEIEIDIIKVKKYNIFMFREITLIFRHLYVQVGLICS